MLHWIPVFTRPESVQILLDSLHYLSEKDSLEIYAYIILENHFHMVARSPDLASSTARFKSFTAKALIAWLSERKVRAILDQLPFAFPRGTVGTRAPRTTRQMPGHPAGEPARVLYPTSWASAASQRLREQCISVPSEWGQRTTPENPEGCRGRAEEARHGRPSGRTPD